MFKLILFFVAQFIVLISGYIFYLWFTYEDKVYTSGEAYGFAIGQDKKVIYDEAYKNIIKIESGLTKVFFMTEVKKSTAAFSATTENKSILVQTHLDEVGYEKFEELNRWRFYLNGSLFNIFELTFEDGKLIEIYRHKKNFEAP